MGRSSPWCADDVVQGRKQLAFRQVAGGAEQDDGVGRWLIRVVIASVLLLVVSAELLAHRRQHLVGDVVVVAAGEAAVQRVGDDTGAGTPSSIAA